MRLGSAIGGRARRILPVLALVLVAATGCIIGNRGDDGGGVASSYEEVRGAVIRIQATGTLAEPDGTRSGDWSGSGFFITPDGLAVTNNHVVAGASILRVHVEGEDDPRRARVVARGECSDLAVIEVDGDGYPFLEWYEDEVDVGLPIYSAGFPLGHPEYTLTAGIVSKRETEDAYAWAAIEGQIEHDARVRGGNSGGPLVATDGRVVGVNFAINAEHDQNFAVAASTATGIVEQLVEGTDVDAIGINPRALIVEDTASGIFVQSVETGTAADDLGLLPGDFILTVERLEVGRTGTMVEFCEILRSRSPDAELAVELLRPGTGELMRGNLNGERTLSVYDTLGDESGDRPPGQDENGVVTLIDDSRVIRVEVPARWNEHRTAPAGSGGDPRVAELMASTSIQGCDRTWTDPCVWIFGVPAGSDFISASESFDALVNANSDQCDSTGSRRSITVGDFEVRTITLQDCSTTAMTLQIAVLQRPGEGRYLQWMCQGGTEADLEGCEHALRTVDWVRG